MKRGAAFFDLDRTLIPGSSLFLLARGLYERDMFRVRDLLRFGWGQLMFQWRGEQTKRTTKAREGINPFTGEKMTFKAKPASKKVRVLPLKSLKALVN